MSEFIEFRNKIKAKLKADWLEILDWKGVIECLQNVVMPKRSISAYMGIVYRYLKDYMIFDDMYEKHNYRVVLENNIIYILYDTKSDFIDTEWKMIVWDRKKIELTKEFLNLTK